MKINNSFCHASYLKNSIACDHDFWYTCVKWFLHRLLQASFSFFLVLILILQAVFEGKRVENGPKWKVITFITCHISGTVHCCKMIVSPGVFFIFFLEFWFFWAVREVKGQKIAQNQKITITSVKRHIWGTVYHMIMIFGTLVKNEDISRCFFLFFSSSKFWFFGLLVG